MRILHVVPTYLPAVRYGGPIYAVHALANAVVNRGHEVHVYTTNVDGPDISSVPLGQPVNRDGVHVWYYQTSVGRRLYRSMDMNRALKSSLRDFDLVHLHSVFLWPTSAAAFTARQFRIPYIIAPRGMLVNGLIQRKSWLAKRAWIALFERENIDKAAAIHVTSEIESRELRELGFRHSRIAVIPNGVDAPQNDLSYNSRGSALNSSQLRPVVLFLGRVNWKKGLDRLIPALAHIPEADLVIAGNDEENYQSTLTKLAKRLGVMDRVRFLGPVNVVEKWDLLRKAQVLVLPSYSENFGNVVLEAMSVGCPVVVTPEVGLAQVVKEANAGLVIEGVPEKLAVGINGLLHEPDNRRRMGEAGRRIAQEEFAWDAIAKRIERLYEACIYEARNNVESDYAGPSYL